MAQNREQLLQISEPNILRGKFDPVGKGYSSNWSFVPYAINAMVYEPFCTDELFMETNVISSLNLNLNPMESSISYSTPDHNSCKRTIRAPESHSFLVRLHKPIIKNNKIGKQYFDQDLAKTRNSTYSCPLSIATPHEPNSSPWRIDPCQLATLNTYEEHIRILTGRLKITWHHNGFKSPFKLIITVLAKNDLCMDTEKFPCLKIGFETVLCISKILKCDGIRHCPIGNEYENDEDSETCSKHKITTQNPRISWWYLSNELIRKLFENAVTKPNDTISYDDILLPKINLTQTNNTDEAAKKHRISLTRGLSKYGPWGYLMLGMLMCGISLLICGLWECCCKRSKPSSPNNNSASNGGGAGVVTNNNSTVNTTNNTIVITSSETVAPPPRYEEEFDLPPSYSALFPIQKPTHNNVEENGQSQTT